jgi:hypothetical protein
MWGEKNMPAIDAPIRRIDQISSPVAEMPRIFGAGRGGKERAVMLPCGVRASVRRYQVET